jgi:DNA polymerase III subunit delta
LPPLTPAAVRSQITRGTLGPLYLIRGVDETEKTRLVDEFVGSTDPGLQAFNVDRLHGGETTAETVVTSARILPMMVPRRIVVVLQAERLLAPKRKGPSARDAESPGAEPEPIANELEPLERYIKKPNESSTVVFVAGALDSQRRIVKLLVSAAGVVECAGPKDQNGAARWVRDRVAGQGMSIEPAAAQELARRARTEDRTRPVDLDRLRADVDRLVLYAADRKVVRLADVAEAVGDENALNVFAVTRAIERGDAAAALRELALVVDSGAAPYAVLGGLAWYVRTAVTSARLPASVEAVFRTDSLLKTSTGDSRALLERLVMELCRR